MAGVKQVLYIKADQNVEVKLKEVTLGDILNMECSDHLVVSKLKTVKLLKFADTGTHRMVVSVLKIIECIHKEYPNLEIQNMGAQDVIVTYENQIRKSKLGEWLKVFAVTLISFIGAAFSIMTFNNDSGTPELFSQIYEMFMGQPRESVSILEFTYCAGLVIGILIFFNHFGKKKFSVDPTPIEIEMRLYENDIQTTLIEDAGRRGKTLDVD